MEGAADERQTHRGLLALHERGLPAAPQGPQRRSPPHATPLQRTNNANQSRKTERLNLLRFPALRPQRLRRDRLLRPVVPDPSQYTRRASAPALHHRLQHLPVTLLGRAAGVRVQRQRGGQLRAAGVGERRVARGAQ